MNVGLNALLLRFPEFGEQILRRMKENNEFENLCSDYELCILMLKKVNQASDLNQSTLQEYLEIKTELEEEVLKFMNKDNLAGE